MLPPANEISVWKGERVQGEGLRGSEVCPSGILCPPALPRSPKEQQWPSL